MVAVESQRVSSGYLVRRPRWDFRYYDPKYLEVEDLLNEGKYPVKPLAEVVRQIVNFGAYSLCNLLVWVDEGVPYLRVTDLKEWGIEWSSVPRIPSEIHDQLPKSKVHPGDVLYSMAGTIGLAVVAPEDLGECNSNQAIAQIRLEAGIDPHYLAVFLNTRLGRHQSERIANGQTVLNINMGEIGKIRVPIPPPAIQSRIAAIMQEAYSARRAMLAEAEALFETMDIWALKLLGISLTGFTPPRSFVVPEHILETRWDIAYHQPLNPALADSTVWCSFDQYAEAVRDTFTPSKEASTTHYYVGIQNMDNNPYSTRENALEMLGREINGLSKRFQGGDVLLARLGPTLVNKKSAIVPSDIRSGCGSPEFLVIHPRQDIDNRFVLWMVKAGFIVEQMLAKTRGATPSRTRLYAVDLHRLRVPKANSSQQQAIGQELEQRYARVKELRTKAEVVVVEAKAHVEQVILGKE